MNIKISVLFINRKTARMEKLMKSETEFIKEWAKIRSIGFFKYIAKDILYYFLIILIGYLLLVPCAILIRHLFFHEAIALAWQRILNILSKRGISLVTGVFVIACIVEFLNTLKWFMNESRYKKITHLKEAKEEMLKRN